MSPTQLSPLKRSPAVSPSPTVASVFASELSASEQQQLKFTEEQWEAEMEERKKHERMIVISGLRVADIARRRFPHLTHAAAVKPVVADFLSRHFDKLSVDAVDYVQEVK